MLLLPKWIEGAKSMPWPKTSRQTPCSRRSLARARHLARSTGLPAVGSSSHVKRNVRLKATRLVPRLLNMCSTAHSTSDNAARGRVESVASASALTSACPILDWNSEAMAVPGFDAVARISSSCTRAAELRSSSWNVYTLGNPCGLHCCSVPNRTSPRRSRSLVTILSW